MAGSSKSGDGGSSTKSSGGGSGSQVSKNASLVMRNVTVKYINVYSVLQTWNTASIVGAVRPTVVQRLAS